MSDLFNKGDFEEINEGFLVESLDVFQKMSKVQEKYNKGDTDTFLNEVRDSIAAKYLGFTHINTAKHGFDARRDGVTGYDFLEVKTASFNARTWGATFNDTNQDKANAFKMRNVYLCLSVWMYASEPLFFAFGTNPEIGHFLEERMNGRPSGSRSTQSISLQNLVNLYGFKIYTVNKTPEEVYQIVKLKSGCRNIDRSSIIQL